MSCNCMSFENEAIDIKRHEQIMELVEDNVEKTHMTEQEGSCPKDNSKAFQWKTWCGGKISTVNSRKGET